MFIVFQSLSTFFIRSKVLNAFLLNENKTKTIREKTAVEFSHVTKNPSHVPTPNIPTQTTCTHPRTHNSIQHNNDNNGNNKHSFRKKRVIKVHRVQNGNFIFPKRRMKNKSIRIASKAYKMNLYPLEWFS